MNEDSGPIGLCGMRLIWSRVQPVVAYWLAGVVPMPRFFTPPVIPAWMWVFIQATLMTASALR